jgi:hypothetical protein
MHMKKPDTLFELYSSLQWHRGGTDSKYVPQINYPILSGM